MKSVAIIGAGYVGKALAKMLEKHYRLVIVDKDTTSVSNPDGTFSTTTAQLRDQANACDLAFVCVPTPMLADGSCDTSAVTDVLAWLNAPVIVIKSTVPPGTTLALAMATGKRLVFSPEFVGEGKYRQPAPFDFNDDMGKVPWLIVGGAPADRAYVLDVLVPVLGPSKRYFMLTSLEAEIVKYMENVYFATKVTFANEFKDICDKVGADYYAVREAWAADPRVDPMHTMVFPDARGYSGKCLPKDVAAIVSWAEENNVHVPLLAAVDLANRQRRPDQYPE